MNTPHPPAATATENCRPARVHGQTVDVLRARPAWSWIYSNLLRVAGHKFYQKPSRHTGFIILQDLIRRQHARIDGKLIQRTKEKTRLVPCP